MTDYVPTVGLEIHAELDTNTKMFCQCKNDPDESNPNVNICPVCMAHPGTLPVINREAVHHVLRVGTAVQGTLADYTEFDRKNYFYPDIPKNYQISQYKYPLVSGGTIGPVQLTRIHLEEDTARSSHGENYSLVDYNRAGVPLMELVTEPVIHDAETAVQFARELRLLLIYLGASHANLEKGEMRIEANVSIAPEGAPFGTKVEVKNLNSFKAVEQAILYEVKRQKEVLSRGDKVIQETRGWDENKQKTFAQRLKEESHDYRYFPDPDLPKLSISSVPEYQLSNLKASLPELPWQRRNRYIDEGIQEVTAQTIVSMPVLADLFETARSELSSKEETVLAANYLSSDLLGLYNKKDTKTRPIEELDGGEVAEIIKLVAAGEVSSRGAKDVLALWVAHGGSPKEIATTNNLLQRSNKDEIAKLALDILASHETVVLEYRSGKESALQFLVGQGMKLSKGAANPKVLADALREAIKSC
jgi:aspartyl-tRNA(Asn)/glutamyl-tRNA(Gln) amidotransferase subunit B